MRKIEQTGQFKRDLKREARGNYRTILSKEFVEIIERIARDAPLASKYRDHALTGNWRDFRDCHVKPDLVLIYRKPKPRFCNWCASGLTANSDYSHSSQGGGAPLRRSA
jgi:mRNA interferase YafQ